MKVLIVDDDALTRVGLRAIIPWEKYGFYIVGEAVNGVEAMSLSRLHHPNIILVDIVMPEMDGIDFINMIREELPSSKFVIVSGMNDINYYKKAINVGVSNYIEKGSLTPGEILQVINQVADEIKKHWVFENNNDTKQDYVNEHIILNEFLNMVIKKQITDPQLIEKKLKSNCLCITPEKLFILAFSFKYEDYRDDNSLSEYTLISFYEDIINGIGKGYMFKNFEDIIVAIVSCPDDYEDGDFIKHLCYRIKECSKQCIDIMPLIGVSRKFSGFNNISTGYYEALDALKEVFFQRDEGIFFSINFSKENKEVVSKVEAEKVKILNIESIHEMDSIKNSLGRILQLMSVSKGLTPDYARGIYMDVLYHIIGLLYRVDINKKVIFDPEFEPKNFIQNSQNIYELNEQFEKLLEKIKNFEQIKPQNAQLQVINHIKEYIDINIYQKISLEDISRRLFLNPSYICRLYKQVTGENIKDYILKRKMEIAKDMLQSSQNLSETAQMLGFSSQSYFIKVFKLFTGFTPKQFIRQTVILTKEIDQADNEL